MDYAHVVKNRIRWLTIQNTRNAPPGSKKEFIKQPCDYQILKNDSEVRWLFKFSFAGMLIRKYFVFLTLTAISIRNVKNNIDVSQQQFCKSYSVIKQSSDLYFKNLEERED